MTTETVDVARAATPGIARDKIAELEAVRKSRVVVYITGDRENAQTRIGMDVFPYFYDVLNRIGHTEKLDLLLYSTGGVTMAGWGLANLVREFADRFSVLIPFKAHSTATLLALGADEIVMGRMGQLSPVDPSISGPFNPIPDGLGPLQLAGQPLPLSVEDVLSYLKLAQEEAGIKQEEGLTHVFNTLSSTVKPIALGSIYRAKEQIKLLARKLLAFHMDETSEKARIDAIIRYLTRELFSHDYLISRQEAKRHLKLKVTNATEDLERLLWVLFTTYADRAELYTPYTPAAALGEADERIVELEGAFIESTDVVFVHRQSKRIRKVQSGQIPGLPVPIAAVGYQEEILKQGWAKV